MGETKRQSYRSIVRSIAMYECFLLTLSKFLGYRTSRAIATCLGCKTQDLVKLAGVDSSDDSCQKTVSIEMETRTRTMFKDNMDDVFLKWFREHFFQLLQSL